MLGQGCMVGMLWKSGQGYVVNWLEILGMMLGTVLFAFPIYNGLELGWWWHHTIPWSKHSQWLTNELHAILNKWFNTHKRRRSHNGGGVLRSHYAGGL
jgi:hypothetical protein